MEWESDSPCHSHTYPRQGCRSPGRRSSWELEFRDCGAIPVWGAASDCGEADQGDVRGDSGEKCLWRKAGQPWKQGDTAESRVGGGAITIASLPTYASIGSWTIERLAHWRPDSLNYRVGPHPGCLFKWLTRGTTEKDPRQGSPLSAWMGRATEKDWPKRPSDHQLQEAQKRLW